jgi:hypothetical protein
MVAAAWSVGTAASLGVAYGFTRRAFRGFDAAVGRPRRDHAGVASEA